MTNKTNYTFFTVSDPDIVEYSVKEITEICGEEVKRKRDAAIFSVNNMAKVFELFVRNQSCKTFCLLLDSCKNITDFSLSNIKDIKSIIGSNSSFSVDVTGVKGQENRIKVSKQFYPKLHAEIASLGLNELDVDHKNPLILFQVYNTENGYLIGLQLNKIDFSSREFRVFAHQASFKGDFAYRAIRELDVKKEDSVLSMFAKDGAIAIETALFQNKLIVRDIQKEDYIQNIALFAKILKDFTVSLPTQKIMVSAFDTSIGTTRAMRNNAKIAKVLEYITMVKCSLDDVDTKFTKNEFNKVIVHLTRKDELDLNDVYYQLKYVLKPDGEVLFISRTSFEVVVPSNFTEIFRKIANRGGSTYSFVCARKK